MIKSVTEMREITERADEAGVVLMLVMTENVKGPAVGTETEIVSLTEGMTDTLVVTWTVVGNDNKRGNVPQKEIETTAERKKRMSTKYETKNVAQTKTGTIAIVQDRAGDARHLVQNDPAHDIGGIVPLLARQPVDILHHDDNRDLRVN